MKILKIIAPISLLLFLIFHGYENRFVWDFKSYQFLLFVTVTFTLLAYDKKINKTEETYFVPTEEYFP